MPHRHTALLAALLVCSAPLSLAQKTKLSSPPQLPPPKAPAPALVDPAGPSVSLNDSEALFDIAVALNACGYDNGLAQSAPVRAQVRDQVNQAVAQSPQAQADRLQLCAFIDQHHLTESALDIAQYVSLALYVTPPPALAPSVQESDMPPDSTAVEGILPILRRFAQDIDLHLIWVSNRAAYDDEIARLHDPLTKMIVDTNVYLKMPASAYNDRRFLVVLEPMLSPAETNARIYGTNYVVVASPSAEGTLHMREVRHSYLHYDIEPLIYARSGAIDRLEPFLRVVRDAPIDYRYRADIDSLVVECIIRAIEARTMDTGVDLKPIPANIARNDVERAYREHNAALAKDGAIRQRTVSRSMSEGFVLTQYFFNQLIGFEKTPVSFKETIGQMVYGMDVSQEVGHLRKLEFVEETTPDILQPVTIKPSPLDMAELDLQKHDPKAATTLTQAALKQHSPDPARAQFILARADLLTGNVDDATAAFDEALRLGSDPRLLAWSHIYLGQIHDVNDERDKAVSEYKAALAVPDIQPDVKAAAEKGIATPFTLPDRPAPDQPDSADHSSNAAPPSSNPQPPAATQPQ
ncbi:MAG TPA: tetratricopeptide repeat protein [Silvibacterium sp.]|nr:tetratricopeptide repeat protein [Silvibacterium sp.]